MESWITCAFPVLNYDPELRKLHSYKMCKPMYYENMKHEMKMNENIDDFKRKTLGTAIFALTIK